MTALYLRAAGVVTALGLDLERTISSLRGGLDAFRRVPHGGLSGEDLQAAPICGFAEALGSLDRYVALAQRSIEACLAGLDHDERQRTAILLGLPRPDRPGSPEGLAELLRKRMASELRMPLEMVQALPLGRVAAFAGLSTATRLLADGRADGCVVGGVDVLTNGESLRGLSQGRLLKEEWDGFIPGEAAAFVHVTSTPGPGAWAGPGAFVSGVAAATEPAIGTKDDPLIGKAVAATFRAAMKQAALPDTGVNLYINDLNGSRVAFEDNAMGLTRYLRTPTHEYDVWHVASFLGETGAACGGIQLAWAQAALELGFAPGRGILISASDGDIRAAAVLQYSGRPDVTRLRRQVSIGRVGIHVRRLAPLPADSFDRGLALSTDGLHDDLVGRHFRELAWLWGVRSHHLNAHDSAWADIDSYEQRLLPHLDALAWAGSEASNLLRAAWDADDELELAAAALVLLSTPLDSNQLAAVIGRATSSPLHEQVLASVVPHMPLALCQTLLTRFVTSDSLALKRAGLKALAVAQYVDAALIRSALSSDDASVIAAAVQCAAALGDLDDVDAILGRIHALARSGVDAVQGGLTKVALLGLGISGTDLPQLWASNLANTSPTACALYCLKEDQSFEVLVRDSPMSAASLEACGWAGEPALIPVLIESLSSNDAECALAAAQSLQRISGLSLRASKATTDSEAEDPSTHGLALDPKVWYEGVQSSGLLNTEARRLRHGVPWHPWTAVEHLRRPQCSMNERLIAAWEHAVIHRRGLPTHPEQFVYAQRTALAALYPA
jgi:3-oxoacyl-[acyl-carrier-protein] synthase-1